MDAGSLRALRALLRVELRQVRLHPWRALLVVVLVAIPVAALVGGGALLRITTRTTEERRAQVLGRAALRVEAGSSLALDAARALLPEHARVETLVAGEDELTGPGRRLGARFLALEPASLASGGLAFGLVRVSAGRAPAGAAEVALSPVLLAGLERALGDSVLLADGPALVTGVVLDPENLDAPVVLRAPPFEPRRAAFALFVALPEPEVVPAAARLRAAGLRVLVRTELEGSDGFEDVALFVVGGFGFMEAALVIGAALAVSLRRRQREIGLLASCGASSGGIRVAVTLAAVAQAGLGALFGSALGVASAAAMVPLLDGWNRRLNGAFELSLPHLAGALVLALVTAALAAALPARGATRLSIRVALGGRRPAMSSSRAWLVLGLALAGGGAGLVLVSRALDDALAAAGILSGSVLALVGFGVVSPWLLDGLARHAASLPLAWRLAVRDAGRFRARNGPVVTAVLAGMALSVLVAALLAAVEGSLAGIPRALRDDQLLIEGSGAAEVARRVELELAGIARAPLAAVYSEGEPVRVSGSERDGWLACGDAALLRVLDVEPDDGSSSGQLYWLAPEESSAATLALAAGARRFATPPVVPVVATQRVRGPEFVLDEAALAALGLQAGPPPGKSLTPWLVRLATPVGTAALRRAQALAAEIPGMFVTADVLERAPQRTLLHLLLALCTLTGLSVVFVATALSALESAADARVLHTVGAAPSVLRGHLAARAGYLAFLGCLLAVPAGLIPALGLLPLANFPLAFVMPWPEIALTVLGLPALAYGGTWLFAALRRAHESKIPEPQRIPMNPARSLSKLAGLLALTVPASVAPQAADVPEMAWESFPSKGEDGLPLEGMLGRIRVPENRALKNDKTIEIAFVVYASTNPEPGPPIFFLIGGPGVPATEYCAATATDPLMRLLDFGDVIGVDQRGTGLSRPNLSEGPEFGYQLPLERAIESADVIAAHTDAVARCIAHWREQGVDPAAYNSVESADDVDDVRRALGFEKIVTWGASYGSHLSLAYLRRHAEHVARAVMIDVEAPDASWKLPSTAQHMLQGIHERVAADPALKVQLPDFLGTLAGILADLRKEPVPVTVNEGRENEAQVMVGAYDLQVSLAGLLADARGHALIPSIVQSLARGDFSRLALATLEDRQVTLPSAMLVLMDCASGASAARRARIEREAADPKNLLGGAINAPYYLETCAACGIPDLGDAFRGPLTCAVPVLFVSGTLDARTPPSNVEEIRAGFSDHAHIVVENAAHDSRELMSEEYRALVYDFLRGKKVASRTIALPPVPLAAPR